MKKDDEVIDHSAVDNDIHLFFKAQSDKSASSSNSSHK